ncbi:MAG: hypothetical protein IPO83_10105 [Chitinophagaceae bacterium]|nr:hypothetical protein [Chitinophagaceae bacterium]
MYLFLKTRPANAFLFSVITVFLNSCTVTYAPNSHNVPLLEEKGELALSAGVYEAAGGTEYAGYEAQGAYAVTHHLGLMTNLLLAGSLSVNGNHSLFEVGTGYYHTLGTSGVFDAYGGIGFGSLHSYTSNSTVINTLNYQRFFMQPSIGYTSRAFDCAFSLRMCGLNYAEQQSAIDEYYENEFGPPKFSILAEPAFTLRGGWKYVKLQLQLGYSINLTDADQFPCTTLSMGAYFTLNKKSYKNSIAK